jgi:hypothetical protein
VVSSTNFGVTVCLEAGYSFVEKNNENMEDKKISIKRSNRQYYHNTKFNWNKGKQQHSCNRN